MSESRSRAEFTANGLHPQGIELIQEFCSTIGINPQMTDEDRKIIEERRKATHQDYGYYHRVVRVDSERNIQYAIVIQVGIRSAIGNGETPHPYLIFTCATEDHIPFITPGGERGIHKRLIKSTEHAFPLIEQIDGVSKPVLECDDGSCAHAYHKTFEEGHITSQPVESFDLGPILAIAEEFPKMSTS